MNSFRHCHTWKTRRVKCNYIPARFESTGNQGMPEYYFGWRYHVGGGGVPAGGQLPNGGSDFLNRSLTLARKRIKNCNVSPPSKLTKMKTLLFALTMVAILSQNISGQNHEVQVYNPFRIDVDPMERLLLVNFEKDPDSVYIGFEPQVFDDKVNGTGHLVIGWRVDGRVDVYHQRGLKLNPDKYNIAGKGLAHMVEREMPGAYFEVNEFGVQAFYGFEDIHQRAVHIKIAESNPRKRKPFGLLAPMGHVAENPSSLPFFLMNDFYFVRKKHTEMALTINGKEHKTDPFPIPLDWTRMTFMRYSANPLLANFNPAFEGALNPLSVQQGWNTFAEDTELEISIEAGKPIIKSLKRKHQEHTVSLSFEPGFPDISSLETNSIKKGSFKIMGHSSTGYVQGEYVVEKGNDGIQISLIPAKGWKPKPDRVSLRFLYKVIKIFRTWPATYEWTASVIEDENHNLFMQSSWARK
jgi:hypothetical protein